MRLTTARITNYKSIENSDPVSIDPAITVMVGQNESGKTAFLQALYKARPIASDMKYDYVEDYPRRLLMQYEDEHESRPAVVAELTFELGSQDIQRINDFAGIELTGSCTFVLTYKYDNRGTVSFRIPEEPYVRHRVTTAHLSTEIRQTAEHSSTVDELIDKLGSLDLNDKEQAFLDDLEQTFAEAETWNSRFLHYVYSSLVAPYIPKFLYFDDYYLLPGKINLADLHRRLTENRLRNEDKTARSLLRLAGIDLTTLTEPTRYESIKAKLEGISIAITDKIFAFWTQNRDLSVEFDIRPDSTDEPPFDEGDNLYIRIRNQRHRITVPFSQRSKGFIWFFSFIAWFDQIQKEVGDKTSLILLLDEPGLSLHALAQGDFLRYVNELSKNHQVLYTTHSPFMVNSDRLDQVRTVEDKQQGGTKVSSNVLSSDQDTIFPLQAALGYSIAQNLFIGRRNLLVEGPSDLIYLQYFSNALGLLGRTVLRDDIVITPVGGLDKLATFIALLGANDLELTVLHDFKGKPDQRLEDLVHQKVIQQRQVLNYAMFRGVSSQNGVKTKLEDTDVEDLMSPGIYLSLFNAAYKDKLGARAIRVKDLPAGSRITSRIEQYLDDNHIQLRPSRGFNHYLVANHLASHPPSQRKLDEFTLGNFDLLFKNINTHFTLE